MSLAELLVILCVALCVFGPQKLPELAENFGKLISKVTLFKHQISKQFDEQKKQLELASNLKRAKDADKQYQSEE